jgi:hypothetical protein
VANPVHYRGVTNPRDDLRATEQSIHHDAKTIIKLEEQKVDLDPIDPEVERISDQVQEVAGALSDKAAAEQDIVEEIQTHEKRRRSN